MALTSFDRLDAELLQVLASDVRRGVLALAEQLGVNRNTAQARLSRVMSGPVVRGWAPVVDLEELGFAVQALVQVELVQGALTAVVARLRETPQVLEVFATTGAADLTVRVAAPSHKAMQQLLQEVHAIPGVDRTHTTVILSTPVPHRLQPLVELATAGAGRGRARS